MQALATTEDGALSPRRPNGDADKHDQKKQQEAHQKQMKESREEIAEWAGR